MIHLENSNGNYLPARKFISVIGVLCPPLGVPGGVADANARIISGADAPMFATRSALTSV